MNLLREIVDHKRSEIETRKRRAALEVLQEAARARPAPAPFAPSLRAAPMGLVAEIKRRSPSAGWIRPEMDAAAAARAYRAGGAQAISVLVDERYFGGSEEDLRAVRVAVELPILYKEFVVDPWQVWHAASLGASAVLLIVAALTRGELAALYEECQAARVEALIEVHDEAELEAAGALGAACVGINNRDLRSLHVSLDTTLRLAAKVPPGATVISESGIRSPEDVRRLREAGVHAVLVGEHLLRHEDLTDAVRRLMSAVW